MQIERVTLDSISQDPANVRKHSERNLEAIVSSLRAFGQQKPIVVDRRGIILAGNGTYEAAKRLGWDSIEIHRTELEGVNATAFAIADNRTAELAEWDYEGLSKQLQTIQEEGFDAMLTGFADYEIAPMLAAKWQPPEIDILPTGNKTKTKHVIGFTDDEWEIVKAAINDIREKNGEELTSSECLVIICQS